ncbi:hypothetical protein ACF073_11455 [Streptomyces sp. NPDC015171]|uniref:hypothetical protein n=1 Tax=Streptomyces sp. NPDC015171 TaxID=3364945 RepID=UPI0036FFABC5
MTGDSTSATAWPPRFHGPPDRPRRHWLDHPDPREPPNRAAALNESTRAGVDAL